MQPSELAAIVSAGAAILLAIYAGIQVRLVHKDVGESKISRNATVVLYILEKMDELREKWHALYALPQDHRTWNARQKELADYVCMNLQRMAFLAESGLFHNRYLLENYAGVFHKCWQKLEGFVRDYREACNEPCTIEKGALQRRHLETFAQKYGEYLKRFRQVTTQGEDQT